MEPEAIRRCPPRLSELTARRSPVSGLGIAATLLMLAAGVCASGCQDGHGVVDPTRRPPPDGPVLVSDPIASALLPGRTAANQRAAPAGSDVAYVSLPPDTVPGGTTAVVRNRRTGRTVATAVIDGGFDPMPVPAIAGDTVDIRVELGAGGSPRVFAQAVPLKYSPAVVRTYPSGGKRDVPLNTTIVIVFSEPVSGNTLTSSSVQLFHGTTPVPGAVSALVGSATAVVFTPNSSLAAHTDYKLIVTQAVRDLTGDPLGSEVTVQFTTGTTVLGAVARVGVLPGDSLEVPVGAQFQLTATAYDAQNHVVTGWPVVWATDNSSVATVNATGLVTTIAQGMVTITANVNGVVGGQRIVVDAAALPVGRVTLIPDSTGELVGQSVYIGAQLTDTSGAPIRQPRPMTWTSLDPSVATVTDYFSRAGSVYGVAPGLARIVGTAEGKSDTALVSVHNVAQLLVSPSRLSLVLQERGSATVSALGDNGVVYPVVWSEVTWASSDAAVASVSSLGEITGLKAGSATITATWNAHEGTADVTVVSLSFTSVSSGDHHFCGVTVSSDAYCWGWNSGGEIGNGNGNSGEYLYPALVQGGYSFAALSAGYYYSCGLTTAGAAYCWGKNDVGQLGDGTNIARTTPVPVSGGNTFASISTGWWQACGVTPNGEAYCWGLNAGNVPVPVSGGLTFAMLSAGGAHICALTSSGAAYCWGDNSEGQLGDGTTIGRPTPVPVAGGLTFATISAGSGHTCAVASSGEGYCWGGNGSGQLGDGTTIARTAPAAVSGGLTFANISAGPGHTCAMTTAGSAYCWGYDYAAELGTGSAQVPWIDSLPRAVIGGYTFIQLSAGGELNTPRPAICAVTALRVAYCWGSSPLKVPGQP